MTPSERARVCELVSFKVDLWTALETVLLNSTGAACVDSGMTRRSLLTEIQADMRRVHMAANLGNTAEERALREAVMLKALRAVASGHKKSRRIAFAVLAMPPGEPRR